MAVTIDKVYDVLEEAKTDHEISRRDYLLKIDFDSVDNNKKSLLWKSIFIEKRTEQKNVQK